MAFSCPLRKYSSDVFSAILTAIKNFVFVILWAGRLRDQVPEITRIVVFPMIRVVIRDGGFDFSSRNTSVLAT